MPRERKTESPTETFDPGRGDYTADGTWITTRDHDLSRDPETSLYWFVTMLCTKRRREPTCPPWRFAQRISRSRFHDAFPNAVASPRHEAHWTAELSARGRTTHIPWWLVGNGTNAESTVIYGGLGINPDGSSPALALFDAEARALDSAFQLQPGETLADIFPGVNITWAQERQSRFLARQAAREAERQRQLDAVRRSQGEP